MKKQEYILGDDLIYVVNSHGIKINEKIADEELFDYRIVQKDSMIDNLIDWISKCRNNDKDLMEDDLEMLMTVKDDYIFSSISINDYIYQDCTEFNSTCEELIKLNAEISLEYLRQELRNERISYGGLLELQSLVEFIDKNDIELLEAAGVPENQD